VPAGVTRNQPVTGVIVAGGENQRFGGSPKGLVLVGGERIIDRVAAAIRTVTPEIVLVANAAEAEDWLPGATVVRDTRPERGSVVGLRTAVAGATGVRLVVAWDMPFVSGDLLKFVVERLGDRAAAVVPDGPRGPEPFCAAYTSACLPAIDAAIDRRDFRMSSLVGLLPSVLHLTIDDVRRFGDPERLFFNVNEAGDLEKAESMLDG
jgi:molybdopterin-guanine dinucleotide biosynthesis protein A